MPHEELVHQLDALRKDAFDRKMTAITAKQKLHQAIDLADSLSLKIHDLQIRTAIDITINVKREFVDKSENNCYDLLFFCASILIGWDTYRKNLKLYGENYV